MSIVGLKVRFRKRGSFLDLLEKIQSFILVTVGRFEIDNIGFVCLFQL